MANELNPPYGVYGDLVDHIAKESRKPIRRYSVNFDLSIADLFAMRGKKNANPAYGFPAESLKCDHAMNVNALDDSDAIRVCMTFSPYGWPDCETTDFGVLGDDPHEEAWKAHQLEREGVKTEIAAGYFWPKPK